MKKLISKLHIRKKLPPPTRITSETIEQHREHILAGGRKFKYPLQYARHKLIINTIIISVVAIIVALGIGWWQLYPAQNTSEFMYRVTKVLPVPVANVDGQPVFYSDYLMKYLSSVHYLTQIEKVNIKTDDGKRQIEYIKQQSMQDAIADAYALKLANSMNISVSESELDAFIKQDRQSVNGEVSEQTYYAVILDYYNWSPAEYRQVKKSKLLRQKVSYAMDKNSNAVLKNINDALVKDPAIDLKVLATSISSQTGTKVNYGTSGWVPKTNQDGGLAIAAAKLKKSELSSVIKSTIGDGYYVIRLLDTNDDRVSYDYIQVPLTAFTNSLNSVIVKGKVQKYISIPDVAK
jgi:hypothetical protein